MNKEQLLNALADQTGQHKDDITKTLNALLDIIGATLAKGDKLLLVGFGTFDIRKRAARPGRNPKPANPSRLRRRSCPNSAPASC